MFEGAKSVRLIPDQIGRGGSKTAASTQNPIIDTLLTYNVTVFLGRWASCSQPYQTGNWSAPSQNGYTVTTAAISQALFNFAAISTTNATLAPTNHLMEHLFDTGNSGTENIILDHSWFNTNGKIAWSTLSGGINFCVPATFLSIRNRCFISWGGFQTTVPLGHFGGTTFQVDNIIYDPGNGAGTYQYDMGVRAPLTAATYIYDASAVSSGTTSVTNGSNKINNATVSGNWSGSTLGVTLGGVAYSVQNPGGYVTSFSVSGTCTGTGGTNQLTINNFHFPVNGDWDGLTINIAAPNAESVVIQSYVFAGANTTVTLNSNLANNHTTATYTVTGEELVLTTAYQGGTTLTQSYTAGTGQLSWTGIGPQYAYAYYDPNTGHVSNVSPITQVTEQNQQNVNVKLQNIALSVHNQDGYRFTKILIFRTLASQGGISGGVLFPIGDGAGNFDTTVSNSFAGGTANYTDNHPDSYLLVNSGLQAPLITNRQPPGPYAHMMYWDGRVWGNPVSDPTAVYFSCDNIQCPFGIPEESVPSTNLLRIPAEDGRVTGMKLVGQYGIITTNRYSYYIIGNNELNYRILRFSSTTSGVSDYQMAEFAGDTTDNSSALVYLGGDAKVYMNSPSYGNVSMSDPIQDLLWSLLGNNQALFSQVRVAPIYVGTQKFLLVSVPLTSTTARTILLYDFDRKVWTVHDPGRFFTGTSRGFPFSSFTTVYQIPTVFGSSQIVPTDFVMSYQGGIYSWFRQPNQATGVDPGFIETFPFDFGKKGLKQLLGIRLLCNVATNQNIQQPSSSANWTIQIVTNEHTLPQYGTTYVPILNPDPVLQLQGGNTLASSVTGSPFPVDAYDARELLLYLPTDPANAMIGHRFIVRVNFPTAGVPVNPYVIWPYQLYAVDVFYKELNEQMDVAA